MWSVYFLGVWGRWIVNLTCTQSFIQTHSLICTIFHQKLWIKCTFWFNAGSWIIENIIERVFFSLFLDPVGSFNPVMPYPNHFPYPAGQSLPFLDLTCPKVNIMFIIFNNPYKQHFTRKCTRSKSLILIQGNWFIRPRGCTSI